MMSGRIADPELNPKTDTRTHPPDASNGGVASRGIYPLSFAQRRLWFVDQLEPGIVAYNISRALRLRGELNVKVLQRVIDALIQRHAVLRTTFTSIDGQAVQVVADRQTIDLPVVDLDGLVSDEKELEARRLAVLEFRRPFDLERGPLIRVKLLRLENRVHLLLLSLLLRYVHVFFRRCV